MYEPQHLVDLQENSGFGTWLSGNNGNSSPTHHRTDSSLVRSVPGNVDSELYKDLVEMIPLVQSLIFIYKAWIDCIYQDTFKGILIP
ncbi:hypothetical protein V6N12_033640 [Hibiscus sabdariffa]|uniref:Uncharacterized protein n=1 Tax=Hibiscus sabdariffa TaxID=183260 RepID=A0ABR2BW76_9ROSI